MASGGDAMTIVAVGRQVPWLSKTFKALAAGQQLEEINLMNHGKTEKCRYFSHWVLKKAVRFWLLVRLEIG